jgi:endonuclease/exonuclease/phosphatase family metal-dependent hydrolase
MTRLCTPLRVMRWNIHKGVGGRDRRYDLLRILDVIAHYEPDLVLLQEVAQGIPSLRNDDQVELLIGWTGLHAAFHPEHQFKHGHYGNLVLSRFPLHDRRHLDLTMGWRKRRGMLQVHAKVPVGSHVRSLVVHNLHLGLAGSERGRQLDKLMGSHVVQRLQHDTPTLIGGDLNDLWGSLGPKFLLPRGFSRIGPLAPTFPSLFPLRPLDGLFSRGDLVVHKGMVGDTKLAIAASDHRPLIADLEIHVSDARTAPHDSQP